MKSLHLEYGNRIGTTKVLYIYLSLSLFWIVTKMLDVRFWKKKQKVKAKIKQTLILDSSLFQTTLKVKICSRSFTDLKEFEEVGAVSGLTKEFRPLGLVQYVTPQSPCRITQNRLGLRFWGRPASWQFRLVSSNHESIRGMAWLTRNHSAALFSPLLWTAFWAMW